jgi:hypothetical protein
MTLINPHTKINSRVAQREISGEPLYDYNRTKVALECNYLALGLNPYAEKRHFLRKQYPVQSKAGKIQYFGSFTDAVIAAYESNSIHLFTINSI